MRTEVENILGISSGQFYNQLDSVVELIRTGRPLDGTFTEISNTSTTEAVHYLCHDTGLFDGGTNDNGTASGLRVPCPAGSKVTFFTVNPANMTQQGIANLECQDHTACDVIVECDSNAASDAVCNQIRACKGTEENTCEARFRQWKGDPDSNIIVQEDPGKRCTNADEVVCTLERVDLRVGKTFYAAVSADAVVQKLGSAVNSRIGVVET